MKAVVTRKSHLTWREIFWDVFLRSKVAQYMADKNRLYSASREHRMAVFAHDWIGTNINLDGVYEGEDIADLFAVLDAVGFEASDLIAIDAGANIGNHSVAFANRFARVEAFEPNPLTFQVLSFNCQFFGNIRVNNFGLGELESSETMRESDDNIGASSVVYSVGQGRTVEVKIKRLDDLALAGEPVGLVKIDVEGMELQVLRGAEGVLRKWRPVVAFEQLARDFPPKGEAPVIAFLRHEGYEICWLEPERFPSSWFVRRLQNLWEFFAGRDVARMIVVGSPVPARFHSMLIGIPRERLPVDAGSQ